MDSRPCVLSKKHLIWIGQQLRTIFALDSFWF